MDELTPEQQQRQEAIRILEKQWVLRHQNKTKASADSQEIGPDPTFSSEQDQNREPKKD